MLAVGTPTAGALANAPCNLTIRARRILAEVSLVGADRTPGAQRLLALCGIPPLLVPVADRDRLLDALGTGDVALLVGGRAPCPSRAALELVQAAIQRGCPVVPVPGPDLAVTALVVSGLPAHSFVYLGDLCALPLARRALLAHVASERRTLVALTSLDCRPAALADLHGTLGDRALVVVTESEGQVQAIWRGTLGGVSGQAWTEMACEPFVLVVGGAQGQPTPWEESQLRTEIRARLDQGLGSRDIAQQLALASGWPRREIYRLTAKEKARSG
jgi:16S rRNA (cytidine1402-2'-O)-methyltransferase